MDRSARELVLQALDYVAARGPLKPLGTAIRWGFVFYLELQRDLAFIRAAGMAYATLVALVPGLAVVLGVLQAIGATDTDEGTVRVLLDRIFGAVPNLSEELMVMLLAIDLRAIGIAGVIGLLVVASRLYLMVERAYSDMFGVPVTRRPLGLRMLSFYFTITAVPVVLVLVVRNSVRIAGEFGLGSLSGDWPALLLEYGVLVAALKLLPATRVRWRPALIGAFVSFVLIEAGRWGFGIYIAWVWDARTMSAIYGSLAIFPVFLIWIYLFWVFALLGVEVAQVSQNFASLVEKELELADANPGYPSAETALRVAAWVGWSFSNGRGPVPEETLVDRTSMEAREVVQVLEVLRDAELVVRAEEGWVLARPASAIQLSEIADAWRACTGVGLQQDKLGHEYSEAIGLEGSLADGIKRWLPAVGPAPLTGSALG